MTISIEDALRAWARGRYDTEAGVELLIRQGSAIYDGVPWIDREGDIASVDVDKLLYESGVWSGGEQRGSHRRLAARRPRCGPVGGHHSGPPESCTGPCRDRARGRLA